MINNYWKDQFIYIVHFMDKKTERMFDCTLILDTELTIKQVTKLLRRSLANQQIKVLNFDLFLEGLGLNEEGYQLLHE
ncbi:hypothetical protein ACJX4N_002523 [Enterococcus faecalis]|uniref:hypothetical protein n=1 Tax=Enterococcus faecalis TaxID=1351 RepID=UPI0012E2FC6E|nr:hypothetical protein [Enterococcus faecalis]EGO5016483.1 hypothetical protein [Enterococcus faecalis]EGO6561354.1 hypothetical protein [Enterococcus faecalis]EGO7560955.1 hypothetical protein [Enterococcus faecalis]EGO7742727.1 hypothetical protein [Enterococcus faecalis]EGO8387412.1 hypothetical protein [Enterococcus faecalis]